MEYEIKHDSGLALGYAKRSVVRFIENGRPIPDALKELPLTWIKKGMGPKKVGRPTQRDRDRALYRRVKSHYIGIMSEEEGLTEICRQIDEGGDGSKYKKALQRLKAKGAVPAVTFIEDFCAHPHILAIDGLEVDEAEHIPQADREFARKLKKDHYPDIP